MPSLYLKDKACWKVHSSKTNRWKNFWLIMTLTYLDGLCIELLSEADDVSFKLSEVTTVWPTSLSSDSMSNWWSLWHSLGIGTLTKTSNLQNDQEKVFFWEPPPPIWCCPCTDQGSCHIMLMQLIPLTKKLSKI